MCGGGCRGVPTRPPMTRSQTTTHPRGGMPAEASCRGEPRSERGGTARPATLGGGAGGGGARPPAKRRARARHRRPGPGGTRRSPAPGRASRATAPWPAFTGRSVRIPEAPPRRIVTPPRLATPRNHTKHPGQHTPGRTHHKHLNTPTPSMSTHRKFTELRNRKGVRGLSRSFGGKPRTPFGDLFKKASQTLCPGRRDQ